jgi:hypothetical protein
VLDKPANAAATKIISSVDRLPGPVIVLARSVDPTFASAFLTKLLACRSAAAAQPFLGYTGYCTDVVQAFFDRSERAFAVAASLAQACVTPILSSERPHRAGR